MQIRALIFGLCLAATPAYATIAGTAQWDVRTTGNDANGGCFDPSVTSPGTNYSVQNSPQVAFTDLVIGATNTQLTSTAHAFTSAYVGNCINVTGGTGFTTGWYEILSVSGSTATMDRAVGTAASTGGTGNLGGGLLTLDQANTNTTGISAVTGSPLNNVIWCTGSYTRTSSLNIANSTMHLVGYTTTHGDNGFCSITTSTNSTVLLNTGSSNNGIQIFENLNLSNTAATTASGIWQLSGHGTAQYWAFKNVKFSGFGNAIDSTDGTPDDVYSISATACEFSGNIVGINASSNDPVYVYVSGSYFHGETDTDVLHPSGNAHTVAIGNIFSSTTNYGLNLGGSGNTIYGNSFYNSTGTGVYLPSNVNIGSISMNVFWNVSTAINENGGATNGLYAGAKTAGMNAYGTGEIGSTWPPSASDVTLTANPFVSASTGNFALNTTAGGGLLLIGHGWPLAFGSTTVSTPTPGAAQASSSSSGASGNFGFSN
jgi:hypothetical protein